MSADIKAVRGINGGYSFGELPQGFYMRSNIDNVVCLTIRWQAAR